MKIKLLDIYISDKKYNIGDEMEATPAECEQLAKDGIKFKVASETNKSLKIPDVKKDK